MRTRVLAIAITACVLVATLAQTAAAASAEDRKKEIRKMRDDTLKELYEARPEAESIIKDAPGYAVFSNVNINIIFVAAGGGHGIVQEKSGKETFMRMGEVGVGLGLGAKDFRVVFVFRNEETLRAFVDKGWEFSGDADAAAKAEDKGGAVSASGNIDSANDGMLIYQFTKNGIALQATVSGTKYWKDKALND